MKGNTISEKVWYFLLDKLKNPYGVAGVMGNLYVESGLNPINLQNSFNTKLQLSDIEYTDLVDAGIYSNFAKDGAGYGLAQWTSSSRKLNLLTQAKLNKTSIGDLQTQLEFLYKELYKYPKILKTLQNATSVKEASDIFMIEFERPANQSDSAKEKRAAHGQNYYDNLAKKEEIIMSNYSKYINSTGTHYISNSGSDERKKYTGGDAGDQTGHEWELRAWYSRPWTHVFRYEKDARVGQTLANLGCAAALNDNIGYDQYQRTTYWKQLQTVNYDPSKITVKCEEDCSAGVAANVKATGYILGIKALQNVSSSMTSRNTINQLKEAGFTVLTEDKYRTSAKYLLPGDILLYANHHVAINVTKGSKATEIKINSQAVAPESFNIIGTATAKSSMFIRGEASSNGKIKGNISAGTTLDVIEIVNDYWYKVVYPKADVGYAYTSNRDNKYYNYKKLEIKAGIQATGIPVKSDNSIKGIYKTTGKVNVRNDAGTEHKSLLRLPAGFEIECNGKYSICNGMKWLYAEFIYQDSRCLGFISSKYLKKV